MDLSNYNYFYYLYNGDLNYKSLLLKTNRGQSSKQIDQEEYTIAVIDNKTILCLKTNYKSYTHSLYLDDQEYIINNILYSDLSDILNHDKSVDYGLFSFTGSKPVNDHKNIGRCDVSMNGPSVFLRGEDDGHGSGFNSNIVSSMDDLLRFQPVISVDGVGHIIYVELKKEEKENFDINENNMPKTARTLYENFKQILEWSILADSPWNSTEEISTTSKLFLEKLNIPEEIKNDLINNQTDMQVARYLKGSENARQRPGIEEISDATEVFNAWIKKFFFYTSVDELFSNIGV